MKTCPHCGRGNFSNLTNCIECKEVLPKDAEQQNDVPITVAAKAQGMHWFWAFLIMSLTRWLMSQIVSALFFSNPFDFNVSGAIVCDYLINYAVLFLWLSLTGKRYANAGAWTFFSYLWYIVSPLSIAGSYAILLQRYYDGNPTSIFIIAVLCSVFGVFYLTHYRKRVK